MRIASFILTVVGVLMNFSLVTQETMWLAIVGLIVGVFMIISLASGKKYVALGVIGIIFTGLLGGIFYLCWNDKDSGDINE